VNPCGSMSAPTGTGAFTLTDNSGYTVYHNGLSFSAIPKDGADFTVPSYVNGTDTYAMQKNPKSAASEDTNGNLISAASTRIFTDTMGKNVVTEAGSAPSSVVYTYIDPNGNSQTVTVNYTTHTVQTAFGVSGITEYNQPNIPLVSSIVYSADGSSFSFTYETTPGNSPNVTGRVASITLRTGGTITYAYTGVNHGIEADGTTAGLKRTTSDGFTTYVRSGVTSSASTTTFTDAASTGNVSVSSFLINASGYFYETDRKSYQGAATGTALAEIQTCYNTAQGSCTGNSVTNAFASVQRTAFSNGTQMDQNYQQYAGPELLQQESDTAFGTTTSYTYNAYTGANSITFYRLDSSVVQLEWIADHQHDFDIRRCRAGTQPNRHQLRLNDIPIRFGN
jgi:hypothetical protein